MPLQTIKIKILEIYKTDISSVWKELSFTQIQAVHSIMGMVALVICPMKLTHSE